MEETKMEEELTMEEKMKIMKEEAKRKIIVKRVQINGVPYLKDRYSFLYKEKKKKKNGNSVGDVVGTLVYIRGAPTVLKKRVALNYLTKSGKYVKINTYLDTLNDMYLKYEQPDANEKKMILDIYNQGLAVIKQIEDIKEEPTTNQHYHFIRAVREVSVIQSVLTTQPLDMLPIMCACCRKDDYDSTFKKCGCCKSVYFCSSECNKLAWAEHKKYCKELLSYEDWL